MIPDLHSFTDNINQMAKKKNEFDDDNQRGKCIRFVCYVASVDENSTPNLWIRQKSEIDDESCAHDGIYTQRARERET